LLPIRCRWKRSELWLVSCWDLFFRVESKTFTLLPLARVICGLVRWINIIRKSRRKHFWIVSPMICFPLWWDKVMIVLHCWVSRMWCYLNIVSRPLKCCALGTDRSHSEANLSNK
jgi:hypothetical protein